MSVFAIVRRCVFPSVCVSMCVRVYVYVFAEVWFCV